VTYVDERDRLTILKDFDEKVIWTSDVIPLMASYHKGSVSHSLVACFPSPFLLDMKFTCDVQENVNTLFGKFKLQITRK
jgi:hypothetical protein